MLSSSTQRDGYLSDELEDVLIAYAVLKIFFTSNRVKQQYSHISSVLISIEC